MSDGPEQAADAAAEKEGPAWLGRAETPAPPDIVDLLIDAGLEVVVEGGVCGRVGDGCDAAVDRDALVLVGGLGERQRGVGYGGGEAVADDEGGVLHG